MAVFFSTRDVDPSERLDCWRDTMASVQHDFYSEVGTAFLGSVHIDCLGEVMIKNFDCDPCEVHRASRHISTSDRDDFILCMPSRGRAVFAQDDRQAVTHNGGLVLLDGSKPFSISYQGATKSVSLSLPRQALAARLGDPGALTVQNVDTHQPIAGLASSFLAMLSQRMSVFDEPTRAKLAEQALDMIALAYSLEGQRSNITLSCTRSANLLRLKGVIERHLRDPNLKPGVAATAAGISVRYANDLLSQESTSLERYILHRRLERCRQGLEDPGQNHRLISEIAFGQGFSSLSHFARRFRAAYGFTPTDYRLRVQGSAANKEE